jgi:hypothetical protein
VDSQQRIAAQLKMSAAVLALTTDGRVADEISRRADSIAAQLVRLDPATIREIRRLSRAAGKLLGLPEEDPAYLDAVAHGYLRAVQVDIDVWSEHGPGLCPDGAHDE